MPFWKHGHPKTGQPHFVEDERPAFSFKTIAKLKITGDKN